MNNYRITYQFEDGCIEEIVVSAAYKCSAYLAFEEIRKDFGEEVVIIRCERI